MDSALLTGADADGLSVLHVANGIALRVLQRDEGYFQVTHSFFRECLVLCRDIVEKTVLRQVDFVTALFEGDTKDLLVFYGCRRIIWVYLDDIVCSLALLLQDFKRLGGESRGNDAIAHLAFDEQGCCLVADVGKRNEIAV